MWAANVIQCFTALKNKVLKLEPCHFSFDCRILGKCRWLHITAIKIGLIG
ncbi:MAG: hypothetical protein ACI9YU_001575 [Flavobacteriales bacterium]|jgi:hypothetical protein